MGIYIILILLEHIFFCRNQNFHVVSLYKISVQSRYHSAKKVVNGKVIQKKGKVAIFGYIF